MRRSSSLELTEGAQPNLLSSIGPSATFTALPAIPATPFLNTDRPVDPHNDVIDERYCSNFCRLLTPHSPARVVVTWHCGWREQPGLLSLKQLWCDLAPLRGPA